jgi:energy-coupling factor transport system permease protein
MPIRYYRTNSLMDSMDAMSKLAWVFVVGAVAYLLSSPLLVALNLAFVCFVCFALGRIPLRIARQPLGYLAILGFGLMFFQVLIRRDGLVLLGTPPFTITDSGLTMGLLFALRVFTISMVSLTFVWTTDPKHFIIGLIRVFKIPYRFAYGVFVALRFLPLMANEFMVIKESHAVRGVAQVNGRFETYKRYTVPLLGSGIRKAEIVALAMDSRAFGAFPYRTYLDDFRWSVTGLSFLTVSLILSAVLVYVNLRLGFALLRLA